MLLVNQPTQPTQPLVVTTQYKIVSVDFFVSFSVFSKYQRYLIPLIEFAQRLKYVSIVIEIYLEKNMD